MSPELNMDGALAAALAKAQSAFPAIPRDKEVTVQTKTGGSYKFKYAPLDSILSAVRQPLADNGLAVTQLIDAGDLVTMLMHKDGGILSGRASLPTVEGGVQAFGSAVTYLRRYGIQAILGIAAEEDDDGNHAAGNTATFGSPAAAPGRPAAPPPPEVETEELVGDFAGTGMVRNGGAAGYKLEARQGPDGHVIGFRLEFKDEKDIPQVVVAGPAGEALFLLTTGNPAALLDTRIHVKGRLFNVKRPSRGSYKRLKVMEWENNEAKFPADDVPLPEPPDDVPLIGEAESPPLFDDVPVAS